MASELADKICLITGALGGIGRATTELFAARAGTVVMLGRGQDRGQQAIRELQQKIKGAQLDFIDCDLSSQASIRKAADQFKSRYPRLDVLFNQVGIFSQERKLTVDGIETMFAVNHLSYFLLTNLLMDVLVKSGPARVINGTGALERLGKIHFDDLSFEKKWSPFKALAQSKLSNLLFTAELARKLAGTKVTANSFHPGGVKTGFGAGASGPIGLLMKFTGMFGATRKRPRSARSTSRPSLRCRTCRVSSSCSRRRPSPRRRREIPSWRGACGRSARS